MDAFEAISLPEPSSAASRKLFTVAQANRALVLVRRIVTDIVSNYDRLRQLHDTYQSLDQQGDLAGAENARVKYAAATDHLAALREELDEIGCELKDYEVGLVDFPSLRDGREILLCWKLGEEHIAHWHEVTTGFADRRPIEP
ncbi:MAG: DUF2203 domain-containing protein [Phycisphaerae bacterium]|nr:DUF2203 domain-containing protein [Phycisphaerae bacterium]